MDNYNPKESVTMTRIELDDALNKEHQKGYIKGYNNAVKEITDGLYYIPNTTAPTIQKVINFIKANFKY